MIKKDFYPFLLLAVIYFIQFFFFDNATPMKTIIFTFLVLVLIKFFRWSNIFHHSMTIKDKIAFVFLFIGLLDSLRLMLSIEESLTLGNILFPYIVFLIFKLYPNRKSKRIPKNSY